MKKLFLHILRLLSLIIFLSSCQEVHEIYSSQSFQIYNDRVVQGTFNAKVNSLGGITSNYTSPQKKPITREISFRFSVNLKNNELPYGEHHKIIVTPNDSGVFYSPIIQFGKPYSGQNRRGKEKLEPLTTVVFRVDLSRIFSDFKNKGYYIDIHGERINQEDFKSIHIASDVFPLRNDYENLYFFDQELLDEDQDGIYEVKIVFNQEAVLEENSSTWVPSRDLSNYPTFHSEIPILNALYDLTIEETKMLSESDGTFRTGAKWDGVWTRDISYSTMLGLPFIDVERIQRSLLRKIQDGKIIQDKGSGGSWPVSSDRIVWAIAAWEVYKYTGSEEWLKQSYDIIKRSLSQDSAIILDPKLGMFRGESSFLDWRAQTYPAWMDNVDIYRSICLSTNLIYFKTYLTLAQMADILGLETEKKQYTTISNDLKKNIKKQLWMSDKGYFAQYLYGRNHLLTSPKPDALGEALAVLFEITDGTETHSILQNTPILEFGIPCIYPQIKDVMPYHNNGIWPFVQSFWNLAAAKAKHNEAVEHGLASLIRSTALFLSNKENMIAENGDYATLQNSDRQLWSVSGFLAMIYKLLFGMEINQNGILRFNPMVPKMLANDMYLKNLVIRECTISISLKGYGNKIQSFIVNGNDTPEHEIDLTKQGEYDIEIILMNNQIPSKQLNIIRNDYQPSFPTLFESDHTINWNKVPEATEYEVFVNGISQGLQTNCFTKRQKGTNEYTVRARDQNGSWSFVSNPFIDRKEAITRVSWSDETIELTTVKNKNIDLVVNIEKEGDYLVWFDYANGSGPWNSDNKCAIRTLSINGNQYPVIMPQRGKELWNSFGTTNRERIKLTKGNNEFEFLLLSENQNMNGNINKARLGKMYLQKMDN